MKACCKKLRAELNRALLENQRLKRELHISEKHRAVLVVEMDVMDADIDDALGEEYEAVYGRQYI
jgi:hypothetical protein